MSDTWTYNGFGELASYSASYGGTSLLDIQYTRDNASQVTQKTETIGGITNTYVYTYDVAGRLTAVSQNGTPSAQYV